ncbi:MAG: Rieske (2Fe-2S) protein [Flavobacterium sp.]
MKKFILLFFTICLFSGCEKDNFNNRNPYIPNYGFSESINMNLPSYSQLQYPSNAIYYPNAGARGVIIFNTGSGYVVFDAACPNQPISDCSTMLISGISAVCPCDDAIYSLFTGQSPGKEYPMKQYRVDKNGNVLHIYN